MYGILYIKYLKIKVSAASKSVVSAQDLVAAKLRRTEPKETSTVPLRARPTGKPRKTKLKVSSTTLRARPIGKLRKTELKETYTILLRAIPRGKLCRK